MLFLSIGQASQNRDMDEDELTRVKSIGFKRIYFAYSNSIVVTRYPSPWNALNNFTSMGFLSTYYGALTGCRR